MGDKMAIDRKLKTRTSVKEFCTKALVECFECEKADYCPLLKELVLKYKNNATVFEVPSTSKVHPKNPLNELSGEQWLYFTKSMLQTVYSSEYCHHLRKQHGANKPPQLMKLLIEFFTKRDGIVLDPFAGVGGTLIGASISNPPRKCIGIEINKKWIDIYHEVCKQENIEKQEMIYGDCLTEMKKMDVESIDFITTDPPYNLHLEKTMCNGRYDEQFKSRKTDYDMKSDDPRDVANLQTYNDYLNKMEEIFEQCYRVLKKKKYMAIILRNAYQKSKYILTHADLARRAEKKGFTLKGEKIWYQAGTRLRPYGYPFAYIPNITHQFIIILQKPDARKK